MKLETGRFGQLSFDESQKIVFEHGLLGFPELTDYCLVDPNDDTLILWLQSLQNPSLSFPVLEPRIFKPGYAVSLSGLDERELGVETGKSELAVFTILTIPDSIQLMSANLKAPVVINVKDKIGKQVVVQENQYSIQHPMFKELKTHLITIQSQQLAQAQKESSPHVLNLADLSLGQRHTVSL